MAWSQKKREFREKLNGETNAFLSSGLSREVIDRKNKTVVKGRRFLSSIEELKSLFSHSYSLNEFFWERFLELASKTLPNASESDYKELCRYLNRLTYEMNIHSLQNHTRGSLNTVSYSLFTIASVSTLTTGALLLDCVVTGTCALAMGPCGVAVLGVGLILLGAMVAAYSAYQVYKNYRLCKDSQLHEITDFVDHLNPNPEVARTEELAAEPLIDEAQIFFAVPQF